MTEREARKRPALDLVWQDERISCELHRSGRGARNLTVRVRPDGSVRVGAPRWVGIAEIRSFIEAHAHWIASQRTAAARLTPRYVTGATHPFLGRLLVLVVSPASRSQASARGHVQLEGDRLHVWSPLVDETTIRDRLRRWYRARADEVFEERAAFICSALEWLNETPLWRQRRMRTQWGNCTKSGEITLNTNLVKAPPHLIDYVIQHEVCHLRYHDHGRGFQALMDHHMPDWRTRRRELNADPALLVE